MNLPDLEVLVPALKTAGATILGAAAYLVAQIQLPDIGDVGNFGLVAVLAVIIGRYTFRQLEDYRKDLKTTRDHNDELNAKIEGLQNDLTKLGQAKAASDKHLRDLEVYTHRLRLWALAAGFTDTEIPPPESLNT